MSKIVLPSLSEDGWVDTDARQADYMFSHFFLTDYSQTQLYLGHVASLSWIIHETQGNPSQLQSLTETTLFAYFSKYFKDVEAEVQVKPSPNNPNIIEIYIYVTFNGKDGKPYNLAKLANVEDSKIKSTVVLSNYGIENIPNDI